MNLGKALVKELNLDPGVDTTARWMAHYIAEQIEIAEHSSGIQKQEAEERCFETILKLWNHRSAFPRGSRPFENFEPILRTLARLDPENDRHFFFENRRDTTDNVPEEIQKWLDVAGGIDEAARVWLKYVFEQAALAATDDSSIEWLENSVALQEEDNFLVIFRELHSDIDDNWGEGQKENERKRKIIVSRIKKLEAFAELNQLLLTEYRNELVKSE
ncbi:MULTISPECIES: hypothetical protein [unclassified Paenibacillus]|uniref:hypothetical protein n=1 Tax=unclassified Paenibacillus TaxID=185978 RepID=UPI00034E1E93|nr:MULTISPECIES: hypothetical protein [unclassified Paenibacillus]EPD88738.1 hypothetical protein HMPREF1207_02167 [Paenibacillus sp. HGH0039]